MKSKRKRKKDFKTSCIKKAGRWICGCFIIPDHYPLREAYVYSLGRTNATRRRSKGGHLLEGGERV